MPVDLDDLPTDYVPPLTPAEEYRHAAYSIALRGGTGDVDVSRACASLVERDPARFGRLVRDYCRAIAAKPHTGSPLLAAFVVLALAGVLQGCGFGAAPPMRIGQSCAFGDTTIEVEVGAPYACEYAQQLLGFYRESYEERFGHADLTGKPVRLRAAADLRATGLDEDFAVGGRTYDDAIDLASSSLADLPHEMHHVRNGPGHHAWCDDFAPWSKAVLGLNQDAYLGCN